MSNRTNQLDPAALAEDVWLREFVQSALGDPRLTSDEERFVVDFRQFVERTGRYADLPAEWRLSHKQADYARHILAKVEVHSRDDRAEGSQF